ncbi:MAG: peroxiredoxin [Deltaproteobacteria bacterium HGW-Deltaproteobacteria-9]|nr:MAG: peroxiredoxin [Deltaproteobacteria bacterium HGW-Deltaproteobacteria-9]
MPAKKVLNVGTKVRNFRLKDQNQNIFQLSGCKGKKVLLSFHPLAWTPVCAKQMLSLEKSNKVFQKLNTKAYGISVDSVPSKNAWAKSLQISQTGLLADFWPHGGVAKALGIFREEGFSERANIIIDENGRIAFTKIYPIGQLPDIKEIIEQLKLI